MGEGRGRGTAAESAQGALLVGQRTFAQHRRAVMILAFAFMLIFSGFNAAQGLQSSLNGNLGFINLTALYITFAICCIVAPALLQRLDSKGIPMIRLLPLCATIYTASILANMRPVPPVDDPGYEFAAALEIFFSVLVGLAAPMLWTVQGTYLASCARAAARCEQTQPTQVLTPGGGDITSRTTSSFNGLFTTLVMFANFAGTGTSSVVLLMGQGGAARTILFLVLGGFTLSGGLCMLALPKMPTAPPTAQQDEAQEDKSGLAQCSQTLTLIFKEQRLALIMPLVFTSGCFSGFVTGDFTQSFVSATVGPAFAGIAQMTFFGVTSAASTMWGGLIHRGSVQVFQAIVVAFLMQLIVLLVLLAARLGMLPLFTEHYKFTPGASSVNEMWVLNGESPLWWEYVVPLGCVAMTAIGNAVYQSQPNAIVQSFFQDKRVTPAMANSTLWQSMGFAASFSMSALLSSLALRIAVIAIFFVVSIAAAAVLHFRVADLAGRRSPRVISRVRADLV